MHAAVRARPCRSTCARRAFNGVPPWPAKSCLAAYTAGPDAHLLRRPRVSLAYSILLQDEQSGAESMSGRHYCRLDRDAVQTAPNIKRSHLLAHCAHKSPLPLLDTFAQSLISPCLVVMAAPLPARTAAAATSPILGFLRRAREAAWGVRVGVGVRVLLQVRAGGERGKRHGTGSLQGAGAGVGPLLPIPFP